MAGMMKVRVNGQWVPVGGPGETDHGNLVGLTDDDHPQYERKDDFTRSFLLMGA